MNDHERLVEAYREAAAERARRITELRHLHRVAPLHRVRRRVGRAARGFLRFARRCASAALRHPVRGVRKVAGAVRARLSPTSLGAWRRRFEASLTRGKERALKSRLVTPFRVLRSMIQGPPAPSPVWVGSSEAPPHFQRLDYGQVARKLGDARPTTVLVPVFGGATDVRRCLDSLVRWTPDNVRILVLDDASPDEPTRRVLVDAENSGRIEVIRRAHNLGYTRNVNAGLDDAGDDDVVLLNSDTIVGPLWVQRLRWVAYSGPKIAAVSPVSDNAGAMAVPEPGVYNDWANSWGWPNAARAMARHTRRFAVDATTAHGFCMYIRREALDDVGSFDVEAFPRGYGEENDWSMRARARGWSVKIAPHAIVRHAQGRSFGSSRQELLGVARETMARLHPNYRGEVRTWMASREMRAVRQDAQGAMLRSRSERHKPRVLSVLHIAGGGTPQTNRELLGALVNEQEAWVVEASPKLVRLHQVREEGWVLVDEWVPQPAFHLDDRWRPDYAAWLTRWMMDLGIETVHVRHLINQPLETLPEVASRLGVPVILSTHDFYMVCPTVNLVDGLGQWCGGVCTPNPLRCELPTVFVQDATDLKRGGVEKWRERAVPIMLSSRAVVATTEAAAEVYRRVLPLASARLTVIEHGRAFPAREVPPWRLDRARRPGPMRLFCAANWNRQKGMELVRELIDLTSPYVEWHLAGRRSEAISDRAIAHGEYLQRDLSDLVASIDPDAVGIFSLGAETYSQTLSEAWGLGLPVIATDLGAVAERIRRHGGGILVDPADPEDIARQLIGFSRNLLRGADAGLPVPSGDALRSVEDMARDYLSLYRGANSGVTIGVVVSDGAGAPYVRLQSRLSRLVDHARAHLLVVPADAIHDVLARRSLDALVVQRDALVEVDGAGALAEARRRGVRIVAELDDDMFSREAEALVGSARVGAVRQLLGLADTVIVSTPALADRVRSHLTTSADVVVTENLVDDGAWGGAPPQITYSPSSTVRWVYWGTPSHQDDLELLEAAFRALARGEVVHTLDVIGVTTEPSDWYNVIRVPPGKHLYRDFAAWLRTTAVERGWHGGLAPLVNSGFNSCKSDLKALEYAMLGLPCLVGDVEPYLHLALRGVPVVEGTPEAWRDAIAVAGTAEWRGSQREFHTYVREERTLANDRSLEVWLAAVAGGQSSRLLTPLLNVAS